MFFSILVLHLTTLLQLLILSRMCSCSQTTCMCRASRALSHMSEPEHEEHALTSCSISMWLTIRSSELLIWFFCFNYLHLILTNLIKQMQINYCISATAHIICGSGWLIYIIKHSITTTSIVLHERLKQEETLERDINQWHLDEVQVQTWHLHIHHRIGKCYNKDGADSFYSFSTIYHHHLMWTRSSSSHSSRVIRRLIRSLMWSTSSS